MFQRATIRTKAIAFLLALPLALGACGDDSDPTGPGDNGDDNGNGGGASAVVVGQVESEPGSAGGVVASGPASRSLTASAARASTVAVAAVRADGSLDVLAEADVEADGTFRIESVPSGRSQLVVVARSDAAAETGRVLVHEETRSGTTITVAPVNGETTVEGRVFGEVRASGEDDESTEGEIALFVHLRSETEAAAVATSQAQINALASVFAESDETLTAVFAEAGTALSAAARAEVLAQTAASHAESRHAGTGARVAHDAFVSASLDAMIDAGASAEAVALATAHVATGLDRAAAQVSSSARLDLARTATEMNLMARQEAAADVAAQTTGDLQAAAQAAASAMAQARAGVNASADLTELRAALQSGAEAGEGAVFDFFLGILTDLGVDAVVRSNVEARLESAFAAADLSAELQGRANVSGQAAAQIVAAHRSSVRAAVDAVIEAMPDGVDVSAEAMTRLLVAVGGNPHVS